MSTIQVSGWGGMRPVEAARYTNIENNMTRTTPPSQVFPGEVASNAEMTFQELKRLGYNCHRVRFGIQALGESPAWSYDENQVRRMVAIAKHFDMWIVLGFSGYREPYQQEDAWMQFWQTVIPVFKDLYEKIIWEPVNEPVMDPLVGQAAVTALAAIYQRWIDMCRGFGDTHWIVVSCACWYLNIPYVDWFPTVTDPLNKVFLGAHFYYFYQWNQTKWTVAGAQQNADGHFNDLKAVIAKHGRPYLCTEMGATPFGGGYEYAQVPGARYGGASGYSDVSLAFMQRMVSNFKSAGWGYILFPCADWGKDWAPGWHHGGLYGGLDVWGQYLPQPMPKLRDAAKVGGLALLGLSVGYAITKA